MIVKRCAGWRVDSIEHLGEGDFCVAYLVNDCRVFRFAKHEKARASLLRESCLLPLIAGRLSLPIPLPELVDAEAVPAFMCYRALPGPALTRERYLRLNESARNACAGQLADFLTRLHSIDVAMARRCGVGDTDYAAQYRELLAGARERLFAKLVEPERAFVEQTVRDYLESTATNDFNPVLLHGDFSPEHVLYDETAASVTGIIDFGDMAVGDPAWDLLFIYEDYGLDFFARVLRLYEPGDATSLLERVYRFYLLGAIEWAVLGIEKTQAELEEALAQLRALGTNAERQYSELLSACGAR